MRDYELYQAVYCGLCRSLGERYGLAARFTVSYDLTFLAMLLSDGAESRCRRRCAVHPLRRRLCLGSGPALQKAAACCVILYWRKLEDRRRDGRLGERLVAGAAGLLLRRAYKRARRDAPELDRTVGDELRRLARLEAEDCRELDPAADCFAAVLAAMSCQAEGEETRRILRELLYHVGRSIYILDAADDLESDVRSGSYNPLRGRFGDSLSPEARETLRGTLNLSQRRAAAAFELLGPGRYAGILENILLLGLPEMATLVLSGEWRQRKKFSRAPRREELERESI